MDQMQTLKINEIFYSIQGESTWAGQRCVFVRLTGCHLRCGYCDTEYAFHEGQSRSIDEIIEQVADLSADCRLVEITGGEPLLQPNVHPLMTRLADAGYTVLLETSGASDISSCDQRVIRIMDLKTPGSGEVERNIWSNIEHLRPADEIKFVITSRADFDWACEMMEKYDLGAKIKAVLLGPVHQMPAGKELAGCTGVSLTELAQWMLDAGRVEAGRAEAGGADGADAGLEDAGAPRAGLPANVRLQTQLHKLIWDPMARGV
jgi:7-carboxy-7-deazaguanine synthase